MSVQISIFLAIDRPGGSSYVAGLERYAWNVCTALRAVGSDYRPTLITFHRGARVDRRDGEITSLLLPDDSALPWDNTALGAALWDAFRPADLIHILQPTHASGAFALSVAHSLGKPVVASHFGGGGLGFMTYEGGLRLATRVVSPSSLLAHSLGAFLGDMVTAMPAPYDDVLFAPPMVAGRRQGVVCADPILPHSRLERLCAAAPAGLPVHLCGPHRDQHYLDHLSGIAGPSVTIEALSDDRALATAFGAAAVAVTGLGPADEQPISLWGLEAMGTGAALLVGEGHPTADLLNGGTGGRTFRDDRDLAHCLHAIADGQWPPPAAAETTAAQTARHYGRVAVGAQLAALYQLLLR